MKQNNKPPKQQKITPVSNLGMGVMIRMLGGNSDTVETFKRSLNKVNKSVKLEADSLRFEFSDGYKMELFDDGQSCCESRYMTTDDNLDYYAGATFLDAEIKDAPCLEDEEGWSVHEVQFLEIKTSKGSFTMETHNEHNGYYGGFYVVAREMK